MYDIHLSEEELLKDFIDSETGEIIYPESDGERMAESTTHFTWITTIQGGIDSLFADKTDVFVAGDLLWYPEQGKPYIRVAPDVMVAFGRPKGARGSYEQWKEDNIPPQVVFEILSKGNTASEMIDKFIFYEKYGVQEYYVYDFEKNKFYVWLREGERLNTMLVMPEFVSPLMGIRFNILGEELQIFHPDGTYFLTYLEQDKMRKDNQLALEEERKAKEEERKAKEDALQQLEKIKQMLKEKGFSLED